MRTWAELPGRIKLLIFFHLILGIAPVTMYAIPNSEWLFPAMWALSSISIAQVMLLSFWVGMSSSSFTERLVGSLCGTAFITTWPTLSRLFLPASVEGRLTTQYFELFCSYYAFLVLIAGAFILMRHRGTTFRRLAMSKTNLPPDRIRYSVGHLLLLTSISAVILAFAVNARSDMTNLPGYVAILGLMLTVFLINSICAAWATLSLGRIGLRIGFVFGVAVLLGLTLSISVGHLEVHWSLLVAGTLITVFFTAIVVGSLLVVRSCGYRLVPKRLEYLIETS